MNPILISLTLGLCGRFTYPFQMTIGELREELEDWPEGDEIIFGCEKLEFRAVKCCRVFEAFVYAV
jgi:hypothetical protein